LSNLTHRGLRGGWTEAIAHIVVAVAESSHDCARDRDRAPDGGLRLQNIRDVGGLRTVDGHAVRHGVLYRSDAPRRGDESPGLTSWPPKHVVDLRSAREAGFGPHPLSGDGTAVTRLSLLPMAGPMDMAREPEERTLASLYAHMVERSGSLIATVVGIVANATGPVLVHCAAGKDRTGLTIALLLASVGVEQQEILRDYRLTEQNLDGIVSRIVSSRPRHERDVLREALTVRRAHLMRAPAEAMGQVLDELAAGSGGIAGWLQTHGASVVDLRHLESRLVDRT
jgi:protein-tyrosine phosphatase